MKIMWTLKKCFHAIWYELPVASNSGLDNLAISPGLRGYEVSM